MKRFWFCGTPLKSIFCGGEQTNHVWGMTLKKDRTFFLLGKIFWGEPVYNFIDRRERFFSKIFVMTPFIIMFGDTKDYVLFHGGDY